METFETYKLKQGKKKLKNIIKTLQKIRLHQKCAAFESLKFCLVAFSSMK